MKPLPSKNWLWDAACKIRGPIDAPKYKDYILPLEDAVVLLEEAEQERARVDKELQNVLKELGF